MTVQNGAAWWLVVERRNRVTAKCTCVTMYAREAVVMWVIPCRQALPDLVAFVSFSMELSEVKMCLYACPLRNKMYKSQTNGGSSPKSEADSWRDHPKALQGRTCGFGRPTVAIDCHRPLFRHLKASFAPWFDLDKSRRMRRAYKELNSLSSQFKPAGQRSRPVTGWWKPQFVLTFHERCGFNAEPLLVIQFNTTSFRLLVSSDRALNTPFWIFEEWGDGPESWTTKTYKFGHFYDLPFLRLQEAI